jgi:hypothetical protein
MEIGLQDWGAEETEFLSHWSQAAEACLTHTHAYTDTHSARAEPV